MSVIRALGVAVLMVVCLLCLVRCLFELYAAIAGKNAIKRVQAGGRHKEAEGFPATDAGIRNAIQNVQ